MNTSKSGRCCFAVSNNSIPSVLGVLKFETSGCFAPKMFVTSVQWRCKGTSARDRPARKPTPGAARWFGVGATQRCRRRKPATAVPKQARGQGPACDISLCCCTCVRWIVSTLLRGYLQRLHTGLHGIGADLPAHIFADQGREPPVKSGNDARFGNLLVEGVEVSEPMRHSRHRRRGQCDLRYFVSAEDCCNCAGFGARPNAMGTWIFGMRWCDIDRLPGRYALRRGIAVDIAIANGGNRSPERVVELCVEDGDQRVHLSDRDKRHEACRVNHGHVLRDRDLTRERLVRPGYHHQPEARVLRLPWCAFRAVLATNVFHLVVVARPLVAGERDWRWGPELGRAGHREWAHRGELPAIDRVRFCIDSRRGRRTKSIPCVVPVISAGFDQLHRDPIPKFNAERLRVSIRYGSKIRIARLRCLRLILGREQLHQHS